MIGNSGNTQLEGFPSFKGSDKPRGACEALALQRLTPDVRALEADLFASKWHDYRLWHPTIATYYYVHCYIEAARRFCAQNNDVERAEQLKVFAVEDIFGSRDLTACVIARQHLDRIGCRYEWALSWMIKRHSDRGWMAFPRPNQLYGEELVMDIGDAWREQCAIALQIPRAAHFQVKDGAQLTPVQREYAEWICEQVRTRTVEHWRPLSRLVGEGVLSVEVARQVFGDTTVSRALKSLGR